MPPLQTKLRNRLEAAVKQARRTAEAAAKVALERLHVGNAEPGSHLSADERQLRNRLRAHGRQLGDGRDPKGAQSIKRLIHECAYEHWHRMLFARFLAENHLLIHEKEGMPVTLAECDELAPDEGAPDGWTLAARYAARMLPQIFRPDDPVLQVGFAPEHKRSLEKLVTELPVEVYTAEDSLGWVYQFWQAERKEQVDASGDKITGETLPAVTQLFTERYMVLFLLHNTIGAWWAARLRSEGRVQKSEWDKCQTEDDCRKLVALPGYEFAYLRFIKDGDGDWVPAAGGFPGWPRSLKDFKLLDPCCGSGHFLVAAFVLLVLLRMQDEKLSARDACDAVLRQNLHGLELDPRCTQIAAFALALTAWKFTDGFRPLPPLNIACSGLGVNARKDDWLALANGDTRLRSGLEQLYDLFQKAPELGSLINPHRLAHGDLVTASLTEIQPLLSQALQSEKARMNVDLNEIGVAATGMARAAEFLSEKHHLVATNVPFLGRGKQDEVLRTFSEQFHPLSKNELSTTFVERCVALCRSGGAAALVSPQSWLFLTSYGKFRAELLRSMCWNLVVRLGPAAFEDMNWWAATTQLLVVSNEPPSPDRQMFGIDVSAPRQPSEKARLLHGTAIQSVIQVAQLSNPDARISLGESSEGELLEKYADAYQGIGTSDNAQFLLCYWEIPHIGCDWRYVQCAPDRPDFIGGSSNILIWEDGRGRYYRHAMALKSVGRLGGWKSGGEAWGKEGLSVKVTGNRYVNLYLGDMFDTTVAVVIPRDAKNLPAIYQFITSSEYKEAIEAIDQGVSITEHTLLKVPFEISRWQAIAEKSGSLPPKSTSDPTQWLFAGHPVDSTPPVQVGVARLLGYHWPRQTGQTVSGAAPVPEDGLEKFVDEDGIVCIPSVRGEPPAAERLRTLLTAAYGKAWSPGKLDELLSAVNYAGSNLEDWLRNGFFDQHSKLFQQRPFIWQIWDGRKDGFSALVNYHKLDHKLLEKLTYTYLGEWLKKQQDAVANEESGADDRLLKAQQLQNKLKLILEGETPFDIFVRWKPLEKQPIGWHPDLNDGVRLNIRPFMEADVLRKRPNIKWGTDRGKNPPGSPWGEERDNDRHLTLEEKRKAREK